jgi:hypothetical protein
LTSPTKLWLSIAVAAGLFTVPAARADVIYTTPLDSTGILADAFVTDGTANNANPNSNYGAAGTMVVAGANSGNGAFESLIKFNLAGAEAAFNSAYGAGNWTINSISLTLASNYGVEGVQPNNAIFSPVNGGAFDISWLANNSWVEGPGTGAGVASNGSTGGITWNSLPNYLTPGVDESLGAFNYTPPGNNIPQTYSLTLGSGLIADVLSGGAATLLLMPGNNTINYLFNTITFAQNHEFLTIDATAVPVPGAAWLFGGALAAFGLSGRRRRAGFSA